MSASQGLSIPVSGGVHRDNGLGIHNRVMLEFLPVHRNVVVVNKKAELNQRRDDVLKRMLHTPPQPKTADKSGKKPSESGPPDGTTSNPLKRKRESATTLPR